LNLPLWALRALLVAAALGAWFWTQALIAKRAFPDGKIGDRLLDLTAPLNRALRHNDRWANALLITTSAIIDMLGLFLLAQGVFGPSVRPFLGLLIVFALRQLCQGLCALPCPDGMIWRSPGVPSLFVTYGTASDLFFSGHTAIAIYGCIELASWGGATFAVIGGVIALIEVSAVLVLRAHYTMDVFTGAVTALWVSNVAGTLAPRVDSLLAGFTR
jgi:hypothetical protein